jgi:hypothetical protein
MVLLALPWLGLAIGHEETRIPPKQRSPLTEVPRRPDIRGPQSSGPAATA